MSESAHALVLKVAPIECFHNIDESEVTLAVVLHQVLHEMLHFRIKTRFLILWLLDWLSCKEVVVLWGLSTERSLN